MSDSIIKLSRNTENAPLSNESTQSVAFSHYNNISAQLPIDPKNGELVSGGIEQQASQCLSGGGPACGRGTSADGCSALKR